ncbi:hypothetical protein niasHT_022521 [Heterodera trifolii]|uniref:mRNA-capping enzyme n=1 Tax=Heterodera trifolii TaxID=157864 RepID=A0ABD2JR06_9BILA
MPKRKLLSFEQNDNPSLKNGQNLKANQRTRLPPRWLYCPPMGKVVAQRFLPMKTPLDSSYDHLIESPKYFFHPSSVFRAPLLGATKGAKIGLWVDLTNSDNFYNEEEVLNNGSKFLKMKMVGHKQAPTPEQTTAFIEAIDRFVTKNPDDVIVVHCTHGFNRTGFLISAYLYEKCDMSIEMAVREFAECRPNGIYKQHYLDDLRKRYGDEDEDEMTFPGRPLWENGPISDEEFTNNGTFIMEATSDNSGVGIASNGPSSSSNNGTQMAKNITNLSGKGTPKFMDGKVVNVSYVEDPNKRRQVQDKTRLFCGYGSKVFPGSQPVSLEGPQGNNNIEFLAQEPYMVSWKADGVRYLVLIDGKYQVYAFDRDNNPFLIRSMAFIRRPRQKPLEDDDFVHDTLVDAEMVIDQNESQQIPRLLIYDLVRFQGEDLRQKPFNVRFEMIENELIRPRTEAFKAGLLKREEEPIGVRRKGFWNIESTRRLLEPGFLSCHEVDGLVFQPVNGGYVSGRCDKLLKWKPPELSSIDFRLDIKKVIRPGELPEFVGNLHVLHADKPFATIKATRQLLPYNNKIIECKFSRETKRWEFMRERTDKSHPNACSTAESVWNTIQNPINKNDLLNFISQYGYGVKRLN